MTLWALWEQLAIFVAFPLLMFVQMRSLERRDHARERRYREERREFEQRLQRLLDPTAAKEDPVAMPIPGPYDVRTRDAARLPVAIARKARP